LTKRNTKKEISATFDKPRYSAITDVEEMEKYRPENK
jgi:hypothetical protein